MGEGAALHWLALATAGGWRSQECFWPTPPRWSHFAPPHVAYPSTSVNLLTLIWVASSCWWIEKKLAPLFQLPRQEIEPATSGLHFSYHLQSERAIYKRPISVSQNNAPSQCLYLGVRLILVKYRLIIIMRLHLADECQQSRNSARD